MLPLKSSLIALAFALTACSSTDGEAQSNMPAAPDYAVDSLWYADRGNADGAADVFYVAPTCVWDWTDSQGNTCHYMDPLHPKQRSLVASSDNLARQLFGKHCRFYAPYYRQLTMNTWFRSPDEIDRMYASAHDDIVNAFQYFIDHINCGRPFILAGHSQGAKAVIELLKNNITPEQQSRLVAAYAIGYRITADELAAHPNIQLATDSVTSGTLIVWNSVADTAAVSPLMSRNVACVNPLNWRCDTTYAPSSANIGAVFFASDGSSDTLRATVGARIDPTTHTLVADGLNPADYYIPSIASLFPMGNYHVQELNLYFLNVQRNLEQRIRAFKQ